VRADGSCGDRSGQMAWRRTQSARGHATSITFRIEEPGVLRPLYIDHTPR
jgi:hypothetical protein